MGETHKKLSIVTFNTFGIHLFAPSITKRYTKIAQLLNDGNYDVVCLQELFTYYHLFLFKKNLKNYPYLVYKKNPFGPQGGLALFSKYPLSDPSYVTYKNPHNAHIPLLTKIAQNGILSAQIRSYSLRICTTHLTSDSVHNLSSEQKLYNLIKSQSIEAAMILKEYTKSTISVVLAGDFNIAKDSELYHNFLKSSEATDIFEKDDSPTYEPNRLSYFYSSPADRCDFMFMSSKGDTYRVLQVNNLFKEKESLTNDKKTYLSDHIALHCILRINE